MATRPNLRLWETRRDEVPEPHSALLEALPFAGAVIDAEGTITAVNGQWTASPEAVTPGQSYVQYCQRLVSTREDAGAVLSAGIRGVLAGRQPSFTFDYPVGTPQNTRCFRVTVTPYNGGALVLSQDVGADSELADPDQRRQAQKMETMGRLVGGVAHDFANLLTLIAGYSDILLNRMSQIDPLRPELDEIRKAAHRGSRLTSQLLGFSRGQSIEPRVLDLNAVIADMQRMLRPIIGEYVELETVLSPNLGRILADPGQMEQVIMNLVLNARDAMHTGGRITIETTNLTIGSEEATARGVEAGPCVVLTVTDTGQGMDAETMRHLFEPFFTTKEKGKGTGLGLSTVFGIVKQNRGDVWARSAPGHGSTFTICLPQAAPAVETVTTGQPRAKSAGGNETILLVEDEDNVRRLLSHILNKRGYQVLEASDGTEALQIFADKGDSVDLLLTDMVMPRMSGRELAEKVQQLRPGLRVIYMSGYTDDVLVRTGALSPGMSFLQKPLRPDVLAEKVRQALDSARAQAAS